MQSAENPKIKRRINTMKNKNKRLKSRMLSGLTALCVTASIGAMPVWAYEPEEVTAGDIV